MKRMSMALACALGGLALPGSAEADGLRQPLSVEPIAFNYDYYADDTQPSPSDRVAQEAESVLAEPSYGAPGEPTPAGPPAPPVPAPAIDATGTSTTFAPPSCTCGGHGWCGACCLGEPWSAWGSLFDCEPCVNIGGWFQTGYHNDSTGLFNKHPGRFHLHQGWVYLERKADPTYRAWDWGFRADLLYGVDAQDTQAFGNPPGTYDFQNGWDHGIYGWALPQLYADVASGNWNIRAGHFFTIIGYETVPAVGNFFYSHSFTMTLNEPFTHTGILASYALNDDVKLYSGWTLGWDTGFEQLNSGNSYLSGISAQLTDNTSLAYSSIIGDFGWRGDDAYMHSLVLNTNLTSKWNYVFQSDYLTVDQTDENNFGINQYLFYKVNDCLTFGNRLEWFKFDSVGLNAAGGAPPLLAFAPPGFNTPATGNFSIYEYTVGANYRPHANVVTRPEMRYQWSPAANYEDWIFGVDVISTF